MISARAFGTGLLGLVLAAHAAQGQDAARYRDFQLGGDIASVSAVTASQASEAKTVHQRPALLQDLEWRRPYSTPGATVAPDPVQQITFSFYNNQLSRLVIDYDRDRTEGLTDADLIDAVSAQYGPVAKAAPKAGVSAGNDDASGKLLARWSGADFAVVLYRMSYASAVRMIVTSVRLDALARTAATQADRLDEREAPQREVARQKKEAGDAKAASERARVANKAAFRP